MGQLRTTVLVYEVPSFLRDVNLATFMLKFGDIISTSHDGMCREWRFDIMVDIKIFYSIPNWLDLEGHRQLVIVSDHKPPCWYCSEIGHLSAVFLGKMALKKPDPAHDTLPPAMVIGKKEASVVSPTVRASP